MLRNICLLVASLSAMSVQAGGWVSEPDNAEGFWANLHGLCGQAFAGTLVHEPGESMTGKRLLMHVRECGDERIRIPFVVGDNLSRTWVLSRQGERMELRHDHRGEDGQPEAVTMYGGVSPNPGSAFGQIFPTDEQSQQVLPDSWPSVWLMSIDPDRQTFTYYARRQATDSYYHVEFDLSEAVEPPPAPWKSDH